jgi:SAM-dependent methyltransferase
MNTRKTKAEELHRTALARANEGDSPGAVRAWRECVDLDPQHAEAFANLGWYEQSRNRPGAAIPHYRRALAARPGWEDVFVNLVDCYTAVRNLPDAEETAARGLEQNPDSIELRAAIHRARRELWVQRLARWVLKTPVVSTLALFPVAAWHRTVSALTVPPALLLERLRSRREGGYTKADPKETRFRMSRYINREHRRAGWARSIGLGYSRAVEYRFVTEAMGPLDGKSVLDIGGAGSPICLDWTALGARVITIDPGDIVGRLREHPAWRSLPPEERPGLVRSDGVALPFPDGSFDIVVSISTLEHIPGNGDTRVMREAARVVRPGGRVVVTVEGGPELRESWEGIPVVGVQYEDAGEEDHRPADAGAGLLLRTYTLEAARERLLRPVDLREIDGGVFDDVRFRGRDALEGTRRPLVKVLFREALYLAGEISYRRTPSGRTPRIGATVFLVMEKTEKSSSR